MSRYADVDTLMQSIRRRLGIASLDNLLESEKAIVKELDSAPSIDIVFCKECKHYQQTQKGKPFKYHRRYCNRGATRATELNDFCSYGERGDE